MKKESKTCIKTFVYRGLGVPIKLIDAPMKKAAGVWCLDLDMNKLMEVVLEAIIHKPFRLTGDELKYIRKRLKMTTAEFGKTFAVTHVAVLKWESGENKISPSLDLCIRLYVLNSLHVKDKEFRNLYLEISLKKLSQSNKAKISPPAIRAEANKLEVLAM